MTKVLLADDDPEYRKVFVQAMEALGHSVRAVASGDELLSAMRQESPDIVFLDVLMPGGGAISRIHEIRDLEPNLPIVVITGNATIYSSPIVTEGMREARARVPKTISLVELQQVIEDLTELH